MLSPKSSRHKIINFHVVNGGISHGEINLAPEIFRGDSTDSNVKDGKLELGKVFSGEEMQRVGKGQNLPSIVAPCTEKEPAPCFLEPSSC